MLLETLDVKRNDVLIYSENVFDFNNNFKIIFKKDKIKRAYKINYFDVCDFINEPTSKNIIVYRLLTNVSSLDAYSTKYGYFIKTHLGMELIYLDPIYAIKDLKNLKFELNLSDFRFKIQQVGFTTITGGKTGADFSEIFSWDMRAVEAQNQNDKIFADALFLFDKNFIDEKNEFSIEDRQRLNMQDTISANVNNLREETNAKQFVNVMAKASFNSTNFEDPSKELKKNMLKQALGINGHQKNIEEEKNVKSFSSFIDKYRNEVYSREDYETPNSLTELFNNKSEKNKFKNINKDSVVLRFTDEK
ncbi:MAG: hypothetical protein V1773_05875 [bacterium]